MNRRDKSDDEERKNLEKYHTTLEANHGKNMNLMGHALAHTIYNLNNSSASDSLRDIQESSKFILSSLFIPFNIL